MLLASKECAWPTRSAPSDGVGAVRTALDQEPAGPSTERVDRVGDQVEAAMHGQSSSVPQDAYTAQVVLTPPEHCDSTSSACSLIPLPWLPAVAAMAALICPCCKSAYPRYSGRGRVESA